MSGGGWAMSAGRSKTGFTGRVFRTFDAHHRPTGAHRTVTVIMRHDRGGLMLVTGREARQLALQALEAHGLALVHQTVDPDEVAL